MTKDRQKRSRIWISVAAIGVALWSFSVGACSSNKSDKFKGYYFPSVAVNGSSQTPPHSMPKHEYPFDSSGNYIGSWALAGNKGSSTSSSRSSRSYKSSSSSSSTRVHRVSKGDTLYGISRKYGVSVSRIKSANGLRSDLIRTGQSLRIPR